MLRQALAYVGETYLGVASAQQCFEEAISKLEAGDIPAAETAIARTFRRLRGKADFDILFNAGVIRARGGRLAQAEDHFLEARKLFPSSTHAAYSLGSVRAVRGNIAGALEMFKLDLPVMTGVGHRTYTNALYLDESGIPTSVRSRSLTFEGISIPPDARAVYVVASDSVYFCRYACAVARSIRMNGGGRIHFHAHIINPTPEVRELARKLQESEQMSLSTETTDLAGLTDDQRKTYYASARYLLLHSLHAIARKPILICDIDQLVMSDIEPILHAGAGEDVALIRFEGQAHNIFSLVSATALLIMPTKGGSWFCRRLVQDIENAFSHPERLTWHLDQAALAMAHLMFPSVKYGFLPPSMIHLTEGEPAPGRPADAGILWSITNSIAGNMGKLDTPTFKSLSAGQG